MTYHEWRAEVEREGHTIEEVMFDVPPSEKLLEFLDRTGTERWQRYAHRYKREYDAKGRSGGSG
jgi:hypothetical protein